MNVSICWGWVPPFCSSPPSRLIYVADRSLYRGCRNTQGLYVTKVLYRAGESSHIMQRVVKKKSLFITHLYITTRLSLNPNRTTEKHSLQDAGDPYSSTVFLTKSIQWEQSIDYILRSETRTCPSFIEWIRMIRSFAKFEDFLVLERKKDEVNPLASNQIA